MRDSNTVVASGVAGIVCSTEVVGLREDIKEEAEQKLSGVVQGCLPGINVRKKVYKSQKAKMSTEGTDMNLSSERRTEGMSIKV